MTLSMHWFAGDNDVRKLTATVEVSHPDGDFDNPRINFGFLFGESDHGSFDGFEVIDAQHYDVWHEEAPFDEDTFATTAVSWGHDTDANKGDATTSDNWAVVTYDYSCGADSVCRYTWTAERYFDT